MSNYIIKAFYTDGEEEFIFIKLKSFCEKRNITLKYIIPYIHKKMALQKENGK